jgi:hypothetical protein
VTVGALRLLSGDLCQDPGCSRELALLAFGKLAERVDLIAFVETGAGDVVEDGSFRSTKTLSGPTSATPSAYCTSLAGRNSTRSCIPKRSTAATGDRQGPDQVLKMRT